MRRAFTTKSTRVASLVRAFEGFIARDRAPKTVAKYGAVLSDFEAAFRNRSVHTIRAADIDTYLTDWVSRFESRHGRRPRPVTIRNVVSALKAFFDYADRFDYLVDAKGHPVRNPMAKIELPSRGSKPINWLKPDEDAALLSCGGTEEERIIIWLLRHTGLRVSEACALRISDFDLSLHHEKLYVREAKTTAGVRVVPLAPELVPRVQQWIAHLKVAHLYHVDAPFLCTSNGTAMHPTYIWRVVKRVGERAGVQVVACACGSKKQTRHLKGCARSLTGENRSAISPHTLRRTFASSLYNRGLPLDAVSKLLGHSSTRVTEEAYAAMTGEKLDRDFRDVLRRAA